MMSRACAALSNLDFFSGDSSCSEEDEKPKCKKDNFTDLCLMGKSSIHISDSDVSDDLSPDDLSLRVVELENALCNQDRFFARFFVRIKRCDSSEIASLRSVHDDMSAKPCDNCNMIMVNYVDLWLVHPHVASLLNGARLELRELRACFTLLGAWTTCPLLRYDLEASVIEIKDLSTNLIIILITMFYPLRVKRVSLSRVRFSMLPKRTPSFSRRSLI
jgi:hypothetical protein